MGSGICGDALVRAANAMLAALGGDQVSLLLPGTATSSDSAGQLGLVDPGVQDVVISPVVTNNLPTGNLGPSRRIEFTLPASALNCSCPRWGLRPWRICLTLRWDYSTMAISSTSRRW